MIRLIKNLQGYTYEMDLEKNLYPSSGYSLETGGTPKNLRTSTSNLKIKHFHEHFYRPENLVLIITGNVKSENIFDTLEKVEDKIFKKREDEPMSSFSRPWQTYLPALDLKEDLIKDLTYASDDQTEGSVIFLFIC